MNRRSWTAWVALASLFAARMSFAAEHGAAHGEVHHGEINWFELGGQTFTFFLFIALIVWKGAPASRSFFLNCHETVKKAVEEAQRAKADALAKAAEYDRKMADIEGELQKLKDTFATTAAAEKAKMIAEAEVTAKRIEKDTQALIQSELEKAQSQLRADAADMAVKLASEILSRELKADDQKRLVNELVQSLSKNATQRAA